MADRFDEMARAWCRDQNIEPGLALDIAYLLRKVDKETRMAAFLACEEMATMLFAREQSEPRPGHRRNWHYRALGARGCADEMRFPEVAERDFTRELLASRKVVEAARACRDTGYDERAVAALNAELAEHAKAGGK